MNLLNALGQGVVLELIEAGEYTSTETGTGVDVSDYEGIAVAILSAAAASAGTTPTLNVKLQHDPAVGGSYADISGATFTEVDDTAGGLCEVIQFNVAAADAFVRAVGTIAGTDTPTFDFSVVYFGVKKAV